MIGMLRLIKGKLKDLKVKMLKGLLMTTRLIVVWLFPVSDDAVHQEKEFKFKNSFCVFSLKGG